LQVHKNEATDSQLTVSSGTSPAEDITSAYRGLLAAAEVRRVTVSRGTATPPAPATADRQTSTEPGRLLVDRGTTPAVDVAAAYRGALGARLAVVTVSRGSMTAPGAERVDKDTVTDCTAVDRASSPVKVRSLAHHFAVVFTGWLGSRMVSVLDSGAVGPEFKS